MNFDFCLSILLERGIGANVNGGLIRMAPQRRDCPVHTRCGDHDIEFGQVRGRKSNLAATFGPGDNFSADTVRSPQQICRFINSPSFQDFTDSGAADHLAVDGGRLDDLKIDVARSAPFGEDGNITAAVAAKEKIWSFDHRSRVEASGHQRAERIPSPSSSGTRATFRKPPKRRSPRAPSIRLVARSRSIVSAPSPVGGWKRDADPRPRRPRVHLTRSPAVELRSKVPHALDALRRSCQS